MVMTTDAWLSAAAVVLLFVAAFTARWWAPQYIINAVWNNWNAAANWDGGLTIPAAGDSVTFDATSTTCYTGTITVNNATYSSNSSITTPDYSAARRR